MMLYITGCAGSGTTLMRRLFHSFQDVEIVRDGLKKNIEEISLVDFIELAQTKPVMLGKRRYWTIFSLDGMSKSKLDRQARMIKRHDIKIINMIRDGRDVILSTVTADKRPITPRRWIHSMRHRQMYGDIINYEVRYEDLVKHPNDIQDTLVKRFGLKPIHRFSDYPDFVPAYEFKMRGAGSDPKGRYSKRRLSGDRIGKNPEAYKRIIKNATLRRHFEDELKRAGYLI